MSKTAITPDQIAAKLTQPGTKPADRLPAPTTEQVNRAVIPGGSKS